MKIPHKNIPTWNADNKEWTTTSFDTQREFALFLLRECFVEPGEYHFHKDGWEELARLGKYWEDNKFYTMLPESTKESHRFWDFEERKNRLGVIWHHQGKARYMTRDYYFLLNYCPIINKENGQEESMITFRDVQYHMMLYEKIAESLHLHSVILKRRQMLFSNCHVAKSLNFLWFENKKTIKWIAYDESYIDDVNGSWKFFNGYVNHLRKYTAWDKVLSPETFPEVQQKEKIKVQGRWLTDGNESTLVAKTTKINPKNGVGGTGFWIWHEEGGFAPKADVTLQFLKPNLESGLEKVGSFCIGGSVGDLKECKPLKKFMLDPTLYQFFAVTTKWYDESKVEKQCGLFIPAQYGMPQAVDEHGNSDVERAFELLDKAEFVGFKAGEEGRIQDEPAWTSLPENEYITLKSQNPRNIKEAFAYREASRWPIRRIEKRQDFIKNEDNALKGRRVELEELNTGEIKWKLSNREDVPYPVDKKAVDKGGVVIMYHEPDPRFRHYGGVDNVEVSVTTTSDSLFSIYIVRGISEIITDDEEGKPVSRTEGIKIVASWTGRLGENPDENNDYAIMLMKLYNAKTLAERNKPNFINRCIQKGIAVKYLMREKELPFNKEMDFSKDYTKDEYGIYMDSAKGEDGRGKKQGMCDDYVIEYFNEELECIYKKDDKGQYTSEKVKIFYGIDRVNDYWLLEECKYVGKENTDRENALRLAIVAAKTYEIQGIKSRVLITKKPIERKPISKGFSLLPKPTNGKKKATRSISFLGR